MGSTDMSSLIGAHGGKQNKRTNVAEAGLAHAVSKWPADDTQISLLDPFGQHTRRGRIIVSVLVAGPGPNADCFA